MAKDRGRFAARSQSAFFVKGRLAIFMKSEIDLAGKISDG
jgi:hypothetical protein